MPELINILIRTSNRPDKFLRCLKSVLNQSYPNIRIIISVDRAVSYIPYGLEVINVSANRQLPYFYDCYCNDLKAQVDDGWFMFLDDDDWLRPNVLSQITFDAPSILHQVKRGNLIAPYSDVFQRGLVGMPCLMLHHSLKDIADIPGTGQGDYWWIKKIRDSVGVSFRPLIVVESDGRGLGK